LNEGGVVTSAQQLRRLCFLCLAAIPAATLAQEHPPLRFYGVGGPFPAETVLNAPFSADVTYTFTQTLTNGTRNEQRVRARYYRDSAGDVRAEWVDIGLGGQKQAAGRYTSIWISLADGVTVVMDPSDQTFRYLGRSLARRIFSAGNAFMMPRGNDTYQYFFDYRDWGTSDQIALGTQQIEGVNTVGERITITTADHDEPGLVEERWESPELKVFISSREIDTHAHVSGSVEYRLTNITRTEPPAELFVVPPYAIASGADNRNDFSHGWLISLGPPCVIGCTPR
jgi:hypothetical protein